MNPLYRLLNLLLLTGLLLLTSPALSQAIRYVKPAPTGTGDGSSWDNASGDLQAMINASNANDQVWVAAGTYKPGGNANTDQSINFTMKNKVAIFGGFVGNETALRQRPVINPIGGQPSSTTLSGDLGVPGNIGDNSWHVISNSPGLTATAVLDGFVITGGYANGGDINSNGGGMLNYAFGDICDPIVRNCAFVNNKAAAQGGGVCNNSYGSRMSPQVTNCLFQGNDANEGGAVANVLRQQQPFTNESMAQPRLTNCVFLGNTANNGGAIYNDTDTYGHLLLHLLNCSFQGNSAYNAGAMYNFGGGGILEARITNSVLWNNGGANAMLSYGRGYGVANYSVIEAGATGYYGGPGYLTTATSPFASATSVALFPCSPAINAGDPAGQPGTVTPYSPVNLPQIDGVGNPRIALGRVDMGALEFQSDVPLPKRLYVRADQTDPGGGDGLTWNTAYKDLQAALNSSYGQCVTEIWVAAGTYKPTGTPDRSSTDRSISFVMRNNLAIYGGFVGTETDLSERPALSPVAGSPSSSTLSGDINNDNTLTGNSYHVISNPAGLTAGTPDRTAVLDGFVVTGGNANGTGDNSRGGGILNNGAGAGNVCSPTLRNCLFQGNAAISGGAIFNSGLASGTSSPRITNCLFQSNTAATGGGVYNYGQSGGVASPQLTNCLFRNNTVTTSGGALCNVGDNTGTSNPALTNCVFLGNAADFGGAIYSDGTSGGSRPQLLHCSFQGNTATTNGGALYSAGASLQLANSVLWNNGGGLPDKSIGNNGATVSASYSLFDDTVTGYTNAGPPTGGGNLTTTTTPFASPTSATLAAISPALNSGNPASQTVAAEPYSATALPQTDLVGNPRLVGCLVDRGAIEDQRTPPTRLYVRANQTDPNGGDGLTWNTAYRDLQAALASPYRQCVVEIWVAAGTYKPTGTPDRSGTDRSISFAMQNGVTIYGGFVGSETAVSGRPTINPVSGQPSSSTLSGDIGTPGDNSDNSYHVISNPAGLTTTAALDGFVITGGNADGTGNNAYGGGLFNNGRGAGQVCSPTLQHCVFVANAALYGGAIYNDGFNAGAASPQLVNCAFRTNSAAVSGGAIYNYGEAGQSSPTLVNCAFEANSAVANGGAMYNTGFSSGRSQPALINCSLRDNTARNGGAIYSMGSAGGVNVQLISSVLWNNGGGNTFFNNAATITASYSFFDDTVTGYTGMAPPTGPFNITATTSPFASPTSIVLATNSPAIDVGAPTNLTIESGPYSATALPQTDLAGNPRIVSCRVDMGAVEDQSERIPTRLYVAASQTANAGNGLSWRTAFTDLQSALTFGCTQRLTEIWVAAGTYKPTSPGTPAATARDIGFRMLPGVNIYGGFVGTETDLSQRPAFNPVAGPGGASQPSSSTLSGDIGTPGDNSDNSYHVINNAGADNRGFPTTPVLLDGFVITDGNANGSDFPQDRGGAMVNLGVVGIIRNCAFINNRAGAGGAMFNDQCRLTMTDCLFQGNTADNGGAMLNRGLSSKLTNCSILSNSATNGGAMTNADSSPELTNCLIMNCSVIGNTGGAILNNEQVQLRCEPKFINCSLLNNKPGRVGYFMFNFSANFFDCEPKLNNCVVWNNGPVLNWGASGPVATYSLFDNATNIDISGPGNLTASVSPFASNTGVALAAGSPAIDAGDNAAYTAAGGPVTDLAGDIRIVGSAIDMGAYEFGSSPLPPTLLTAATPNPVCAGSSVVLSVTATGGSSTYSYTWAAPQGIILSGSSTSAVSASVGAGVSGVQTLTITVADATTPTPTRSTSFVSLTVSAPPAVTIMPNPSLTIGAGQTTTLTASGASAYAWSTGVSTTAISVSGAGPYSVTGTTNGCQATASVVVSVTSVAPFITSQPATASSVCEGASVVVSVSVVGTVSRYQWLKGGNPMPGQTGPTLALGNVQGSDGGVYSLLVSGPGGNATSNGFTLTVNPLPTVTLLVPNSVTAQGSGIATITVPTNGLPTTFQATGGVSYERLIILDRINGFEIRQVDSNTTGLFPINRLGLFTLTVTGANGCSRTVQWVVQTP